MANKNEGEGEGTIPAIEEEPTFSDLHKLLLNTRHYMEIDIKDSVDGIQKAIEGKANECKIELNKSSLEQRLEGKANEYKIDLRISSMEEKLEESSLSSLPSRSIQQLGHRIEQPSTSDQYTG